MNWPLVAISIALGGILGASITIAFRLTDIRVELQKVKQAIYNREACFSIHRSKRNH